MADDTTTTSAEGTGDPGPNGAPGGGSEGHTPAANTTPATEPAEKTFTQAQLDQHAGRRAVEAKRAALNELSQKLGMTPDDAAKVIADHQAAEDAKKDELTRAQEALAAAQRQAETAQAETARLQRESLIERKLVAAGVGSGHPADKREAVLTRARAALVLADDADAEAIDAEIQNTVDLIPGLIAPQGQVNGDQRQPAPSGVTNGAAPPAGGQPTKTAMERGRERARAAAQPTGGTERPDPFAQIRTA